MLPTMENQPLENLESLTALIGEKLIKCGMRVTFAESCTGGGLSQAATSIAGSSAWFDLGVVTYSNAMKQALLAVPERLLEEHGAVSEPVVLAMARGALSLAGADLVVTTSGIAGPGGGSPLKPVGTVCFAWGAESGLHATTEVFAGDRAQVRQQATFFGLKCLLAYLQRFS